MEKIKKEEMNNSEFPWCITAVRHQTKMRNKNEGKYGRGE